MFRGITLLTLIGSFLFSTFCFAQLDSVFIHEIRIVGNKKTKEKTIIRQIDFEAQKAYSAKDLQDRITTSEASLKNLSLFNVATIEVAEIGNGLAIAIITIEERWYLFPVPIFELADRNFNVWWEEQNRDFSRVNYGTKFYWENFTGVGDRLKLVAQFGYSPKQEVKYTLPYFNSKTDYGMVAIISRVTNKQIATHSLNNKLEFLETGDRLRNKYYTALGITKRFKDFRSFHKLELAYHQTDIKQSVAIANPNYFGEGKTLQRYFSLYYNFDIDRTDFVEYPTKGYYLKFEAVKHGLQLFNDVNHWSFNATLNNFTQIANKQYLVLGTKTQVSFPKNQPFFNQRGLGYAQNFVRGYELYVVDGQDYLLLKSAYKYHALSTVINPPIWKKFDNIPIDIFLKTYSDYGWVNDNNEVEGDLANKSLFGYGIGIDIKSYYHTIARLEYSFNSLGENGLFLHLTLPLGNDNSYIW